MPIQKIFKDTYIPKSRCEKVLVLSLNVDRHILTSHKVYKNLFTGPPISPVQGVKSSYKEFMAFPWQSWGIEASIDEAGFVSILPHSFLRNVL